MYKATKYDFENKTYETFTADDIDKIDEWLGDAEEYTVEVIET